MSKRGRAPSIARGARVSAGPKGGAEGSELLPRSSPVAPKYRRGSAIWRKRRQ
ncbi:hypothetical protein LguiB_036031 [Lonicera macranthoides]